MKHNQTVRDRLHLALRLRKETHAGLSRKLRDQAPGLRGRSRPSIVSYLKPPSDKDAVEPSVAFLREAAKVLRVYEPWLVSGVGEPDWDDREERKQRYNKSREKHAREVAEDRYLIGQQLAITFRRFSAQPEAVRGVVLDLFYKLQQRYCLLPTASEQTELGSDLRLARELGSALSYPLEVLGLNTSDSHELQAYLLAICSGLLAVVPSLQQSSAGIIDNRAWSAYRQLISSADPSGADT